MHVSASRRAFCIVYKQVLRLDGIHGGMYDKHVLMEEIIMVVQLLAAFVAAFVVCLLFGRRLIPWLEKHDVRQKTRDEVETGIYSPDGQEKD